MINKKRIKMHAMHPLLVDLTLITVYAAIIMLLFKKMRQPTVLAYLIAGILAGPYFNLIPTVSDEANLTLWADVGVIFLLFSLGLEFGFNKMVSVGKSALITATLNIFLLLFLGYYAGLFLGWNKINSFFLGSMISMSSTTIIIKAFDDLKMTKERFTDLVFGVLIVEDMMGILLLALLPSIAVGKGFHLEALWPAALKLITFLVLCFIAGIYLLPTILKKLEHFLDDEMLLIFSIALTLSMVWFASYFGFSSALGAFIMGSVLSETIVIHRIQKVLKPLKDFFGAVFFVSVGMMVDPKMFITYAYPILIITLLVVSSKAILSVFGFLISGQNLKISVQGGLSLAQVGEFAFIIAALGNHLKVLDGFVYPIIVAVSVVTTFLTPIMIQSSVRIYRGLKKILPQKLLKKIDKTSQMPNSTITEEKLWIELFKGYFIRILLFSLILYAVLAFFSQVVQPLTRLCFTKRIVLTLLVLVIMSPFLKGLTGRNMVLTEGFYKFLIKIGLKKTPILPFCKEGENQNCTPTSKSLFKGALTKNKDKIKTLLISDERVAKIYAVLWYARYANRLPLLILTSCKLFLVVFFILTALHRFLTKNTEVSFILLAVLLFMISRSGWLFRQYLKIEKQFLHNLKGKSNADKHQTKGESL